MQNWGRLQEESPAVGDSATEDTFISGVAFWLFALPVNSFKEKETTEGKKKKKKVGFVISCVLSHKTKTKNQGSLGEAENPLLIVHQKLFGEKIEM